MSNSYLGTVDIKICGKDCKLKYDWSAISEILTKHGSSILTELARTPPAIIAEILSIGLKADGVTAEDIMKESPPLLPLIRAIDQAYVYAYYGPDGAPGDLADNKKKKADQTK